MTDLPPLRTARPSLSPAARALRLQRIFARLQEGASYAAIATEEGLSRERLRQIVKAATTRRGTPPDHRTMQFARLEPALRLAASRVAEGDMKAIPLLLKLVDRLDRYCDPDGLNATPQLGDLFPRARRRRPRGGAKLPADEDAAQAVEAQNSRELTPTP
jgi:transposase-like protein